MMRYVGMLSHSRSRTEELSMGIMTDDDVLRPPQPEQMEGFLQFRPTECESYRGPATKAAKLQRVHVQ